MVTKKNAKTVSKSKDKSPSKKPVSTKNTSVKKKVDTTKDTKTTIDAKKIPKKQKNTSFKKYLTFGIVILFVGLAALFAYNNYSNLNESSDIETISIEKFAEKEALETRLKEQYSIDRSTYGMGKIYYSDIGEYKQFKLTDIFKNLPAIPNDFWRTKYEMSSGQISMKTLADMDSAYYLQPEFIKNNFIDGGINFWKNPDIYHWYPEGYGTYPHQAYVNTIPGDDFDVYTFTYTSWGVEGYQGFSLNPAYPETIVNPEGNKVYTNPDNAQKYFTISISPNALLLEPTYPIFMDDWSQKIQVHVKVSEDTPAGIYAIGYDVGNAPSDLEEEWQDQHRELYQGKSGFSIPVAQFEIYVNVN